MAAAGIDAGKANLDWQWRGGRVCRGLPTLGRVSAISSSVCRRWARSGSWWKPLGATKSPCSKPAATAGCGFPGSIRARRATLPARRASWPRPMPSTLVCWPSWLGCSVIACGATSRRRCGSSSCGIGCAGAAGGRRAPGAEAAGGHGAADGAQAHRAHPRRAGPRTCRDRAHHEGADPGARITCVALQQGPGPGVPGDRAGPAPGAGPTRSRADREAHRRSTDEPGQRPRAGQRRIRGGRAPVRVALYMATLSVVRWDPADEGALPAAAIARSWARSRWWPACAKLLGMVNARRRDELRAEALTMA